MLDVIKFLYFVKEPLRGLAVFIFGFQPVTAYMHHAEDKAHRGARPEGRCIASVAVALQITLEIIFIRLRLYDVSGPGTSIVKYWCPLKLSSPIWLFIFLGQPIY